MTNNLQQLFKPVIPFHLHARIGAAIQSAVLDLDGKMLTYCADSSDLLPHEVDILKGSTVLSIM
jgi:hypothetical protein